MDIRQQAPSSLKKTDPAKLLLLFSCVIIVLAGFKAASSFFVPVLLSFFIATVSFPVTNWLRERKMPRWLCVLLTVLLDFAFLAGLVIIVIALLGDLQNKWDGNGERSYKFLMERKIENASIYIEEQLTKMEVENAHDKVDQYFQSKVIEQINQIDFGSVWTLGTDVVGRVASFFGSSFLVLVLTIFMLTEARMYGRQLTAICEARGPNFERLLSASKDIQRFLAIKTLVSLITGFLAGFLCWIADLDFYLLWGILAFALNYIPIMGSIIAGVPPALLALTLYGWPHSIAVAAGYISINFLLGNFVEPMMMGSRFGLSTLVIILSVFFWGWLWGPAGMLMAVPLTMLIKTVLSNSKEYGWLAIAISQEDRSLLRKYPPKKPEEASEDSGAPEGALYLGSLSNE